MLAFPVSGNSVGMVCFSSCSDSAVSVWAFWVTVSLKIPTFSFSLAISPFSPAICSSS